MGAQEASAASAAAAKKSADDAAAAAKTAGDAATKVIEEGVALGSVDAAKDTAVIGNDVVVGKGEN